MFNLDWEGKCDGVNKLYSCLGGGLKMQKTHKNSVTELKNMCKCNPSPKKSKNIKNARCFTCFFHFFCVLVEKIVKMFKNSNFHPKLKKKLKKKNCKKIVNYGFVSIFFIFFSISLHFSFNFKIWALGISFWRAFQLLKTCPFGIWEEV